ncbi:hypothetical protein SAMN02745729_104180 [Marinobacterium iners DSM 11526]|uniref:Uncharacterized protein n=1 Tax=Marinobacterium iners DSM 11526 TaxID=1122198 RepID=A0A1H4C4L0_9GAMM|nr:hypothetical protein SAMN02745729_104180 [Marinobacterium iners DSM 11526]
MWLELSSTAEKHLNQAVASFVTGTLGSEFRQLQLCECSHGAG